MILDRRFKILMLKLCHSVTPQLFATKKLSASNQVRVFLKRYNPERKKIRLGIQTDRNGLSDPLYPSDCPVLMAA